MNRQKDRQKERKPLSQKESKSLREIGNANQKSISVVAQTSYLLITDKSRVATDAKIAEMGAKTGQGRRQGRTCEGDGDKDEHVKETETKTKTETEIGARKKTETEKVARKKTETGKRDEDKN